MKVNVNYRAKGDNKDKANSPFPVTWPLIAATSLLLAACSTTSETFDCQAGQGVGCKSISEVNQLVDQGSLGTASQGFQPVLLSPTLHDPSLPSAIEAPLLDGFQVQRVQEEHLQVWVAPFQDEEGNLHEGSVVHTVLKPGYWRLNTPTAETGERP